MKTHRIVLALTAAGMLAGLLAGCTDPDGAGSKPPEVSVTIPGADASEATKIAAVPNVVGKNHQLAQDTMQAAGFFKLLEEDATGQNRLLINDRNWVVVSQRPRPGSRVPLDTAVTLRSKKQTDP